MKTEPERRRAAEGPSYARRRQILAGLYKEEREGLHGDDRVPFRPSLHDRMTESKEHE